MSNCPHCSYELVLLSSRQKYKCALCSRLYPQKEMENRTFRIWNQKQKELDTENYEQEYKKEVIQLKELRKSIKQLFKNPVKDSKEYYKKNKEKINQKMREWRLKNREYDLKRKREYSKKNRELLNAKAKLRRQNNPELERQSKKLWRANNLNQMRIYGMIQHYRTKQKTLALRYLKNNTYSPSNDQIFHSVPTFALSYLLK